MQCPVCKETRMEPDELAENLITHACATCGGHYIKSERYFSWLKQHGENLPEKPPGEQASLPVPDSRPGKLCPECGAFLIRHKVGHGIDFHLDRCGRCGGIWLDKNEWQVLKGRNLHDDVHFVFSEAWQTQVKQEERSKQYRDVVVGVLDGKLAQHCSQADIARLKEFKDWIDDHPCRKELYAYLASTRDL